MNINFRKSIAFLVFTLILGINSSFVCAGEKIRIGIGVLPPWKYEADGRLQGAEIDMLEVVVKRLGFEVEYVVLPFKRVLFQMESGQLDLMIGLLKRPEREKYIYYIEPPYKTKSNKVFYVLKGNEQKLREYTDLYKLKIGTKIGAKFFPQFDSDPNLDKDEVADYLLNIRKLIKKRIDTFVITDSQGEYLVTSMGLQDELVVAPYSYSKNNPSYFGVARKSPLFAKLAEIAPVISNMIKTGEVNKIFDAYFRRQNLSIPLYK